MHSCFIHFFLFIYDGCVLSDLTPTELLDPALYLPTHFFVPKAKKFIWMRFISGYRGNRASYLWMPWTLGIGPRT